MSISQNFGNNRPSLLLDFASVGRLDPRVTFARASSGTYFDQLGVLQSAANDAPRFDYNPSTLAAQGLLIEEQRTNSIRNNTGQGAVAGTPGTLPTNWSVVGGGLTANVIGTGTESGINYIDIQLVGTASSASAGIRFEPTNFIAASSGQTWSGSFYARIVSGSITNFNDIRVNVFARTSANAANADNGSGADFKGSLTASNLSQARRTHSLTLADATTAFINTQFLFGLNSGAAVDITLRIGLPQLEQGAFATSVISTTTTALTRSADAAIMTGTNFSEWYNNAAGTFLIQYSSQATAGTDRRVLTLEDANGISVNGASMFISNIAQKAASFNNFVSSSNIGRIDSVAAFSANTTYKGAFAMTNSDRGLSVNGAAAVTSTNAFSMPSLIRMYIGQSGAGSNSINSYIQRIAYYPSRLSNAQLQALTG